MAHGCASPAARPPDQRSRDALQDGPLDLNVETLAEQANLSPRSFARLFKDEPHDTPAKLVEKLRLRHAMAMLANDRLALKQISDRCGFHSEEQLRRAFRRDLGVTPQAYRTRSN